MPMLPVRAILLESEGGKLSTSAKRSTTWQRIITKTMAPRRLMT